MEMIIVDRNRRDGNGNTIKPNDRWYTLSNTARTTIIDEVVNGNPPSINESIYNNSDLRVALEELFEFKCAYCGYDVSSSQWEIEHFRPKGAVFDSKNHPGYYWLAYTWSNLYLSCTYCNQRRKDKPLYGDSSTARTDGKGTQFPLADEKDLVFSHNGDISDESPLLLDPCIDDPEDHLIYDPFGNIIPLGRSLRGSATIRIFHLDRRRLAKARKKVIEAIASLLEIKQGLDSKGYVQEALELER